jgi:haloalkane dehalogenase
MTSQVMDLQPSVRHPPTSAVYRPKESPMSSTARTAEVITRHRSDGRTFSADGVTSFVLDKGRGEPVVCMHGMWGSSFLYRKVIDELAARGLRGVAWDLPGFGLADRPADYDYTWSGHGRFSVAAADALGLDRFHLVVHDIGGPVGFELAAAGPDRIASLTILNAMIDVADWTPPWSMRPFRRRAIGELWLAALNRPAFRALMRLQGIGDPSKVSTAELNAYLTLMRGSDSGKGFLRTSRGAQRTAERQALYRRVVSNPGYPVTVIWAKDDPAMRLAKYGEQARTAAGLDSIITIPGKHFPQEDHAPEIVDQIMATLDRRGAHR